MDTPSIVIYQARQQWLCETRHCEEGRTRHGRQSPTALLNLAKPSEAPALSVWECTHHPEP